MNRSATANQSNLRIMVDASKEGRYPGHLATLITSLRVKNKGLYAPLQVIIQSSSLIMYNIL
jgi:hypothetical protein